MIKTYSAYRESMSDMLADIRAFLVQINRKQENILEYDLLAEELLLKLIEASDPDEELAINFRRRSVAPSIVMSCKGSPLYLDEEQDDLGMRIILDYSDRINYARKYGANQIIISMGTATENIAKHTHIAGVGAIVTSLLMCVLLDESQLNFLVAQIFGPVLMLFVKLLANIATPVAFISLLAYVSNFHDAYEFNGKMKKIAGDFIFTSILAVLIPFVLIFTVSIRIIGDENGNIGGVSLHSRETIYVLGDSAQEIIDHLLPDNLIEIFTTSNPLPMLLIAALFGIVINSYAGRGNERVRTGIRTIEELLCKVITCIFSLLPFFLYIAIVGLVLRNYVIHELKPLLLILGIIVAMIGIMLALHCIIYAVEIKLAGISLKAFWNKYKDALIQNFRIGSNVDALPCNIRMFRRKLRNPEKESAVRFILGFGSKVNMDGNCIIITTFAMIIIKSMDFKFSFLFLLEILLVIILLGIGCPNQPGSFTIATTVLIGVMQFSDAVFFVVIIMESIFFRFYSSINAFGDIVVVVINEDDELRKN